MSLEQTVRFIEKIQISPLKLKRAKNFKKVTGLSKKVQDQKS